MTYDDMMDHLKDQADMTAPNCGECDEVARLRADNARLREELDLRWNDLSNIQLLLSGPGGVSLDEIAGLAVALDRTLATRRAKERT